MRVTAGARCDSKREACNEVAKPVPWRGLTFELRRGAKGAKRPL